MGWGAYLAPEAAVAAFNRVANVKCRVQTSSAKKTGVAVNELARRRPKLPPA